MSTEESARPVSRTVSTPPADAGRDARGGLAAGVLGTGEVLAQSIANVAPTYGAALTIGLIAGTAGNGAWLTWLLATGVFVIVGLCVVTFARRYATAGSLYSFVSIGLGARPAFVVGMGWIAIVLTGPVLVLVFGTYTFAILHSAGVSTDDGVRIAVYLLGTASAAWVSFRGIQLSTRLLLLFELLSMALILLVMIVVIAKQGSPFDHAQLDLRGVSLNDVFKGLVLAAFAFGGFESAAALGLEAREPRRQVPLAVLGSTVIVGLFFVINAYGQSYGFAAHHESLASSATPLSDLAEFAGLGSLKTLLNVGIAVSAWSCMLANFNHGSRMVLTLSRDRALPRFLSRSHPRYLTPSVAVLGFAIVWSAALTVLVVASGSVLNWENWLGTFQGYIYILGYVLVSVAAVAVAVRLGTSRRVGVTAGVVAAVALVVVFEQSVVPLPASPFNVVLYVFIVFVVATVLYFSVRARSDRGLAARVVASAEESGV